MEIVIQNRDTKQYVIVENPDREVWYAWDIHFKHTKSKKQATKFKYLNTAVWVARHISCGTKYGATILEQ